MTEPLRVGIYAELPNVGEHGGLENAVIGLVYALGRLTDGPEEYVIAGPSQNPEWLKPYVGPNQELVIRTPPKRIPARQRLATRIRRVAASVPGVPISGGFWESLRCQVMHFPTQYYELTALRTVYTPHDLQHLHFPEFFAPHAIAYRDALLRAGCHHAQVVVAGSRWVQEDLIASFQLDHRKVQVIPWAPATQAFAEPSASVMESVRRVYDLEPGFALYPAVTWPHKNHLRLLQALARLRDDHGIAVRLVCTGHQTPFFAEIRAAVEALRLQDQVKFLGLVPTELFRGLYRLSGFVIVPSLFEAVSGPVFEAWQEGIPVACSTSTSLPEQVRDAALLFDPLSVEAITQALRRMQSDSSLRRDLQQRGARRLRDFSWERTARAYRAVYRRASGQPLSDADDQILAKDWMAAPDREQVDAR